MSCSCHIQTRLLAIAGRTIVSLAMLFGASHSYGDETPLPDVVVNDPKGGAKSIADDGIYTFERDLQRLVAERNGPKEIFALASSAAGDLLFPGGEEPDNVRDILIVLVFEKGGELRWRGSYGEKQRRWQLSGDQIKSIREFTNHHGIDGFPPLVVPRLIGGKETMIAGGTIHVYLHLDAKWCRRVFMDNPPITAEHDVPLDDPSWKYTHVVNFFRALKETTERRAKNNSPSLKDADERRE